MRRGEFVTAILPGEYGKARPALVVQADAYSDLPSVILCPVTTHVREVTAEIRPTVAPSVGNGLLRPSQVMVDKISVVPLSRVGQRIGTADEELMQRINEALAQMLGLV